MNKIQARIIILLCSEDFREKTIYGLCARLDKSYSCIWSNLKILEAGDLVSHHPHGKKIMYDVITEVITLRDAIQTLKEKIPKS